MSPGPDAAFSLHKDWISSRNRGTFTTPQSRRQRAKSSPTVRDDRGHIPAMLDATRPSHSARAPGPCRHGNIELLATFDRYQNRHGRAPGTRERYQRVLRHYLAWLDQLDATTVAAADVDRYLDHWREHFITSYRRPPAPASYRGQINALRAFYRHLNHLDLLKTPDRQPLPDPTRWLQAPAAHPADNDWLRQPEDHALQTCPGSLQDRFTVQLLRTTGIRVSEATSLTRADLDLTPGQETLTIRQSKTPAGRRTIPLLPDFLPLLHQWLKQLDKRGLTAPSAHPRLHLAHHQTPRPQRPHPPPHLRQPPPQQRPPPRNRQQTLMWERLWPFWFRGLLGHSNTTITQHHYAQLLDHTTRHELYQALQLTN
jgi:site-specific recombinase XerD